MLVIKKLTQNATVEERREKSAKDKTQFAIKIPEATKVSVEIYFGTKKNVRCNNWRSFKEFT